MKEMTVLSVNACHAVLERSETDLHWHVLNHPNVTSSRSYQPSGYKLVLWGTSGHQHAWVWIALPTIQTTQQFATKYSLCVDGTASILQSVSLYPDGPANQDVFHYSIPTGYQAGQNVCLWDNRIALFHHSSLWLCFNNAAQMIPGYVMN